MAVLFVSSFYRQHSDKVEWIQPRDATDWLVLGSCAAFFAGGGWLGAVGAGAYLGYKKWFANPLPSPPHAPRPVSPPPPEARFVIDDEPPNLRMEPPPPVTVRSPEPNELCYARRVVPYEEQVALPLPNEGNSCWAACLAQTVLIPFLEKPLQRKIELLKRQAGEEQHRERKRELQRQLSGARQLLSFIEYYRAGAMRCAAEKLPLDTPIHFAIDAIEDMAPHLAVQRQQMRKEYFRSDLLLSLQAQANSLPSQQKKQWASFFTKYQNMQAAKVNLVALEKDLAKFGCKGFLPQYFQQDPDEILGILTDFLFEAQDVPRFFQFLFLDADTVYPLSAAKYNGRIPIPLEPRSVFVEENGRRVEHYVAKEEMEFPTLVQNAFYDKGVAPFRIGGQERRPLAKREFYDRPPHFLILHFLRFLSKNGSSYRIEGAIRGIGEILEFPEGYFGQGKATYRLDGAISHQGNNPNSGHYTCDVRKWNSDGISYFVHCNDQEVSPITTSEFLKAASLTYLLVFTLITSESAPLFGPSAGHRSRLLENGVESKENN